MLRPKYIMARSYQLTGALGAIVTDAGGMGRAISVASQYTWVRARLAYYGWTGTSAAEPLELITATLTAINGGAGGGSWDIQPEPDGRLRVSWSGPGTGLIFAGPLTRALGFAGGLSIAAGSSVVAHYPPQGVLLWAAAKGDSDWLPSSDGATAQDQRGRVYRRSAGIVTYARTLTAWWLPRSWSDNDTGEYFNPLYWDEAAFAGDSEARAPDPVGSTATGPMSWLDGLYGVDGAVPWGFADNFSSLAPDARVSEVYLAPEVYEVARISLPEEAANLRPRRSIQLALSRTGHFEIAL